MNFYIILSGIILASSALFLILGFLFCSFSNSSTIDNKICDESELYEL